MAKSNIAALLTSIGYGEDSSDRLSYQNRFRYVHDIISLSRVPESLTIILWCTIFVIFDLIICLQANAFNWYSSLLPDNFMDNPSKGNFIFSELNIQQAAFVLIMIAFIMVGFQ